MALEGIGNERKKGLTSKVNFCKWLRWKSSHCGKRKHQTTKKQQFQNDEMKVNWNQGYLNVHVFNSSYGESTPISWKMLGKKWEF
jgi:REP element-mobilizing transposase RayT